MITSIALDKLHPSPRNVRRTTDEQADRQLQADIAARGLLQNLVVTRRKKPRGSFAVEAGGRRLAALKALAEDGKLPPTHEVACLVLEVGEGSEEASLAENFQRLRMNPADECVAFQQLIEQGGAVEDIARRFGLTVRFVEGRLRLAGLAPVVFEALGAGEISLDVAKAYAATPDRDRQEYVFEQLGCGYGAAYPDSIRRMMTQATVSAADRRALFVGEEAYLAAGGRIEGDLFSDDGGTRWLDIAILERLAGDKLAAAAADLRADCGLGFVRPTLDSWIGQAHTHGLRRVPLEAPPLTAEETAQVDALEAEADALIAALEDEEADRAERDEAEAKLRALNGRIETIVDKPPVVDDALKATLGAFVMLDEAGRPRLDTVYYAELSEAGGHDGQSDDDGVHPDHGASRPPRPAGLSQRLVDELAMQRRDILAVHVAADAGLARDLATFLMIDLEAGYSGENSGSTLSAMAPANPVRGFETPDAAATIARAAADDALDRSWAEGDTRAGRFDAFRALDEAARAGWLAHAVARTLEASLSLPGGRACAFHDHLGQLLGIEPARWWRPTGANYFDRVPKALALGALEEVGGAALAARYAKAKKAELAETCERIFAGDFVAEVEVKQAATAWVPQPMRFAPPGDPLIEGAGEAGGEDGAAPVPGEAAGDIGEAA